MNTQTVIDNAIEAVKKDLKSRLVVCWTLGRCLNELWKIKPETRPDNKQPVYKNHIAKLNRALERATGQTYTDSSWKQWRVVAERINQHGIKMLAAECVTIHETVLAVFMRGRNQESVNEWVMEIVEHKRKRNHYTQQEEKKRGKGISAAPMKTAPVEHERGITIRPPLDEDKLLCLFRSTINYAILGGLCLADVEQAFTEAKAMMPKQKGVAA